MAPMMDLETLFTATQPAAAAPKPFVAPPFVAPTPAPTKTTSAHVPRPSISVAERVRAAPSAPPTPTSAVSSPSPIASESPREPIKLRARSPTQPHVVAAAAAPAHAPASASLPRVATPPAPTQIIATIPDAISEQLTKITTLLESQNQTLVAQNNQISELTKEVDMLKEKVSEGSGVTTVVVGNEELEEEGRRKDEIIRKLELELEEARS